jgi:peptide/nickel transport system permease protein
VTATSVAPGPVEGAPPTSPGRLRRVGSAVRVYVLPRLLTLWVISAVVFFATKALSVNVARQVLGREVTQEQLDEFNHAHGFDKPPLQQYVVWLKGFLTGDWGVAPATGIPIRDTVMSRLGPTLLLAGISLAIAVPLSIGLGVFMAKRAGRPADLALSMATVCLAATPVFVVGIVLILVVSVHLGLTPVDSTALTFGTPAQRAAAYILPSVTLALALVPHITRITRASIWDTLAAPYAQAGVLRGLTRRTVTWRYLLPNASAPIVNAVALDMMWLVTGVILVENVFAFPGLGSLIVSAVQSGDIFTVQAVVMVTGALFICISLAADLLVVALTPRLRES